MKKILLLSLGLLLCSTSAFGAVATQGVSMRATNGVARNPKLIDPVVTGAELSIESGAAIRATAGDLNIGADTPADYLNFIGILRGDGSGLTNLPSSGSGIPTSAGSGTNTTLHTPRTYNQTNINVLTLGDDVLSEGSIRFWDGSDGQFYTLETQSGGLSLNGDFTSTTGFFGPGSGLQNLNADDVVNGQLQAQILSTNAPMAGAFLMASSATNSRWSFDGSGLTNLPSSGGSGIQTNGGSGIGNTFSNTVVRGQTNYATSSGLYQTFASTWTSNSTYAAPFHFMQSWNYQTTYDHDHPDINTIFGYNILSSPGHNPNEPGLYQSFENRWQNLDGFEQPEWYMTYVNPTNGFGTNYSFRWFSFTPQYRIISGATNQTYIGSEASFETERFLVRPPNWAGTSPLVVTSARGVGSASVTLAGILTTTTNDSNSGGWALLGGSGQYTVPSGFTASSVYSGVDWDNNIGVRPDFYLYSAGTAKAWTTIGFTNLSLERNGIYIHGAQSRLQATNISAANITNTAVTAALAWGDANGKQGEATAANVASLWTGSGVYMTRFGTNADAGGGGSSPAYANTVPIVRNTNSTDASLMYSTDTPAAWIDSSGLGTIYLRDKGGGGWSANLGVSSGLKFRVSGDFDVRVGATDGAAVLQFQVNSGSVAMTANNGTRAFNVTDTQIGATNPDWPNGAFLFYDSSASIIRATNSPVFTGMTLTGNLSVGGGFIGLGAGVTNAAGFGMAGTNETRAVTFTNGSSLFSGNYRAPTNGVSSGTWSTIGGLYITNVTGGNVTLGAFADVPVNVAWSIPFFVTNGDTSVHDLIFPAGTRVNGTSIAPARYTVTNATALFGQVMGIGNLVTNVSAPNATGL